MTKKKKHKYKIGTEVKFKFFDGSVHVGAILKQTYQGDNWDHIDTDYKQPLYTIQVPGRIKKRKGKSESMKDIHCICKI